MKMFRTLRADEIDVRISQIAQNGVMLLLYKDARCDQNILDETVGPMGWERRHSRDNANCVVAIWDDVKHQWVEKEDTGTESQSEAEKGLASDSFKRACVNWGIGRELYSAPDMWFPKTSCNIKSGKDGKEKCWDKFVVTDIEYDDNENITFVQVLNKDTGVCKAYGVRTAKKDGMPRQMELAVVQPKEEEPVKGVSEEQRQQFMDAIQNLNISKEEKVATYHKLLDQVGLKNTVMMNVKQWETVMELVKKL